MEKEGLRIRQQTSLVVKSWLEPLDCDVGRDRKQEEDYKELTYL